MSEPENICDHPECDGTTVGVFYERPTFPTYCVRCDRHKPSLEPYWQDGRITVYNGDALSVLKLLPSNTFHSIVADPPAGISFMGKGWDDDKGGRKQWIAWLASILTECYRVLKPGAYGVLWSLPRTSHWTATAIEDAGFEIRDCIMHVFGSGFPKNMDVSKAFDKRAGAKRKVVGKRTLGGNAAVALKDKGGTYGVQVGSAPSIEVDVTEPSTDEAKQWDGWGTALKPAQEAWWLIRKPPVGAIIDNIKQHGVGAINVDACRVGSSGATTRSEQTEYPKNEDGTEDRSGSWARTGHAVIEINEGRWPPNLLLSHSHDCVTGRCEPDCPVGLMDKQSGILKSGIGNAAVQQQSDSVVTFNRNQFSIPGVNQHGDSGGASRFFPTFQPDPFQPEYDAPFLYAAKPSSSEKNAGLETMAEDKTIDDGRAKAAENPYQRGKTKRKLTHPTVKSQALMRWFVRLVTPPGGTVLDCFAGSGSTLMAARSEDMRATGIELSPEYAEFIKARVSHVGKQPNLFEHTDTPLVDERVYMKPVAQRTLFEGISHTCTVPVTQRRLCGKPAVRSFEGIALCHEHAEEVSDEL